MTSPWGIRDSRSPELRRLGDCLARTGVFFPNHLRWLADNGYSREDIRQIRYLIEAAYSGIGAGPALPVTTLLAAWPGYLEKIESDRARVAPQFSQAALQIERQAANLPPDRCQDIVLICALRRMFIRSEIAARQALTI